MKSVFKNLIAFIMTTATISATDYQTYIQSLPKVELHLHLGGSYPIEYLESIATVQQIEMVKAQIKSIDEGIDYNEAFKIFDTVSQIVDTDEKAKLGTQALCRSLKKDGVIYAEIRTGLKDMGSGVEGYLKNILAALQSENCETFQSRLLLSLRRSSKPAQVSQTIELALRYKDQGVVGIDLSGISILGNVNDILPELIKAKNAGLLMTVHMGEAIGETDQMLLLNTLNPDRIGHAVLLEDEAASWIKQNQIPVEVCLTSSLKVGMTQHYQGHPWLNYPSISICTDDPLIFNTSVSKEMVKLYETGFKNLDEIESFARTAIDQAFAKDLQQLKDLHHVNISYIKATPDRAQELTQFAVDSNDYYKFRNAPMDVVVSVLGTSEEDIQNGLTKVMMKDGEMIGFYTLRDIKEDSGETIHELKDLFIKPAYIGKGYGKLLFNKSALDAKYELGWNYFQLESDPFAAWFYRKLGAIELGTGPCLLNLEYHTTIFRYEL